MAVCIVLAPEQAHQHFIGKRADFPPLKGRVMKDNTLCSTIVSHLSAGMSFQGFKKSLLGRIESCVSEKNAARERWMLSPI